MTKGTLLEPLAWFAFAAVAVTGVSALAFLVGQQIYRQTLNDPQIQMAEDASARLNGGEVPAALVERGAPPIDISGSLSPWLAIYDASGMQLEASAVLDNVPPQPPVGVFDVTKWSEHKTREVPAGIETTLSWQPRPDVREALVLVQTKDKKYVVVAGRNTRAHEQRIQQLALNSFVIWIFTLVCLFIASFFGWGLLKTKHS